MSREEAIKELKESLDTLREYDIAHSSRLKQALEMAIRTLENHDIFMKRAYSQGKQDALSQEPCGDYISRKSIKQKLQEHHDFFVNAYGGFSNLSQNDKSRVDEITNCIAMVVNEPPVTPQALSQEPCDKCLHNHTSICGNCKDYDEYEPCTDAVSRAELLKAIDTWDKFGYTETGCFVREPKGDYVPYIHYDDVIKSIKGMPSVTQKSGKWIEEVNDFGEIAKYHCSKCYEDTGFTTDCKWKFCPNCGAKMESEEQTDAT